MLTANPCKHGVRENICAMCMRAYIVELEMAIRDVTTRAPDPNKLREWYGWMLQRLNAAVRV